MTSYIGKLPIAIPAGIEVKIEGRNFFAKDTKDSGSYVVPEGIIVAVEGNKIVLTAVDDLRPTCTKHGLARSTVAGMVRGVRNGYSKTLEIVNTGYHTVIKGQDIEFFFDHPHTITVNPPEDITLKVIDASHVVVEGTDKQVVDQIAANIRRLRAPEPYKGKGIKYSDRRILRKAGKAGK